MITKGFKNMDIVTIRILFNDFNHGKVLNTKEDEIRYKEVIEEYKEKKALPLYLIEIDSDIKCVDHETMYKYFEEKVAKENVEEILKQQYTFETFVTYSAVDLLVRAGYSFDEIVDILVS